MSKVSRRAGVTVLALFVSFLVTSIVGGETLRAGEWKGTFVTHDGTRYKIKYIVEYDEGSEAEPIIIMINLDLEPVSEFTYRLVDIKIEKDKIQFKIPKEFETKECFLTKKNDAYSGTCKSSAGDSTEASVITMYPVTQ